MSLYKMIKDACDKANQQEYLRSIQQENNRKWQQYRFRYWFLAMVLDDALKANLALLKVQPPMMPKLLMPSDYQPKNRIDYMYVVNRNLQNVPDSDNAVLTREVIMRLTNYFNVCGFSNFEVYCREDTYNYYVTIHTLVDFCLGHTLSPGIGEIIYDDKLYNSYTSFYGMYNIKLHNGGTCGGLSVGKRFDIYHDGVWSDTAVAFDDNGNLILTLTNMPLDNYVGWIARI